MRKEARVVGELMTRNPIAVGPKTSLRQVLTTMKEDDCRQLPIVDDNNKVIGIVTDRDVRLAMNSPLVLRERWQDETLLDTVTAEGCMTANPLTVTEDTPLYQAAQLLCDHKFGALPVTKNGELVGILSVTDLLRRFIADERARAG
jgi:acetoin utilization protein AcuB